MYRFLLWFGGIFMAGMLCASPLYAQSFDSQPQSAVPMRQISSNSVPNSTATEEDDFSDDFDEDYVDSQFAAGKKIAFGSQNDRDQEVILMFMKDFNVYQSSSGQIRCSMRFSIVTNLASKITSISYRLQWPKMETVLNFENVDPEIENYYDYTLLGEGCYSMDKSPNIIINRCRVKGMSQKDCANKVRWITQVK